MLPQRLPVRPMVTAFLRSDRPNVIRQHSLSMNQRNMKEPTRDRNKNEISLALVWSFVRRANQRRTYFLGCSSHPPRRLLGLLTRPFPPKRGETQAKLNASQVRFIPPNRDEREFGFSLLFEIDSIPVDLISFTSIFRIASIRFIILICFD